ncbi:MAG: hypothetical protein M5R40_26160 [Anaerolineae bacterium]|nr:hypothetical protein [Anaerolineae bacterium]
MRRVLLLLLALLLAGCNPGPPPALGTLDTICVEVDQNYKVIEDPEFSLPIREVVTEYLDAMGLEVVSGVTRVMQP